MLGVSLVVLSASIHAATLTGRVIRVIDGDQLVLLDTSNVQYRIRLLGIDAPELKQPYGYRARDNLSALVSGRFVVVDFIPDTSVGEVAGRVLLNRLDINLQQIQDGLAWYDQQLDSGKNNTDFTLYRRKEAEARLARRGLWFAPDPKPPWVFRAGK